MNKLYTSKLLLLFSFLLASFIPAQAQTIIDNTATGATIPTGWSGVNNVTTQAIQQSNYYLVQSTTAPVYDYLVSNTYASINGASSVTVEFDIATYGSGTNSPLKVDMSTDGGSNWTSTQTSGATPTSTTYVSTSVTFSGTVSSTNVVFRFYDGIAGDKAVRLKNIVIKATFPTTFTVTYDANGGTGSQTDPSSPYASGSTVTVLGAGSIARTGYTFSGWNTAANGSGTSYSAGNTFSISSNTTLFAQWTINSYSVSYDGNGNDGGSAPATQNGNYNSTVTLSGAGTLTRSGFTFNGWNTAANGSGTPYAAGANFTIPANNTTLYAQWNATCTPPADPSGSITVSANPSCGPASLSYSSGYYWQTSATGTSTASPTSSNYTLNATGTMYVRAFNGSCWSNNSLSSGTVTIHTAVSIGSGGQPADQTVTAPTAATFSVSNISGTVSGYQWQVNTGSGWSDISGATSASYNTGATSSGMSGYQYRCIVKGTSPCSDVTSSPATLTVNVSASVIAQFDFTSSPYLNYTLKDPNVTVTDMALSAGTIETNITTGTYFPNEPYVEETGGWTSTSQSGAKNFNFTIDAVPGYQIQVTSIEFNAYATSAGPSAYSYDISSGAATFTVNAPDASLVSVNQSVSGVSGQTSVPVLIQGWLNGSRSSAGTGVFRLDDVIVRGFVSPICSLPTTQASAPAFSNLGSTQLDISGSRGNGNGGVLIIARAGSAPTDPSSGTSYTGNPVYGSGSSVGSGFAVFNANPSTTYGATITGLSPETRYYFNAYEWNTSGTCYNLSENASNTWTLSTEPTGHSAVFSSTASNYNQVDLSFSGSSGIGADGYVILRRSDGTNPTTSGVTDGVAPGSWSLPPGTVLVTTTTSGTTFSNTGLTGSTNYCYLLIPYNWNGTNPETYNYRTAATVPSTCAPTPAPPSTNSDIVLSGMTYTSNIDYTAYQASGPLTNTSGNVGVMGITIRDGGSSSPDADALPTILTGITFSGITGTSMIRTAALFEGNALVSNTATINTGSNTIAFSGLSYSTADNSTRDLTLRVSFLTAVTDNLQMTFSVANADVTTASGSTSSQMSAFTTVNSSTIGDRNRIEVTATKIAFQTQPSTTTINATMSPSPVVRALDVNNNLDLDYTTAITINSTGTMTGNPISVGASNGIATFNSVVHTVAGTGYILTASSGAFASVNSNLFDIVNIVFNNGDYRTTGSGSWVSNNATPAIWERLVSGVWTTSNSPAYNTANTVYIQNGHTITTGGSFGSSVNLVVLQGGIFNCNHASTTASIRVYDGGTLNINAALTNSGTFEVQDNGTVTINHKYGDGSTTTPALWNGTENFYPNSNLVLYKYDCQDDFLIPDNSSISTNTYNGYTAAFGNIILDFGSNLDASDDWIMLASGVNINMAHGDLIFRSNDAANGADMRISTTGTVTSGIGGNFHVENSYIGAVFINFKTSGTLIFTIKGDMLLEAATVRGLPSSIAGCTSTINIEGNMTVGASAVFDFNSTIAGTTPAPSATINLKGDLTVAISGLLQNSNSSYNGILNFTGTGDGLTDATTQTIDIASTSSNENRYINFFVKNGAYVKLINRDLELGTNDTLTVENGGVLDFGFNGTTALLVKGSGTQTGQTFRSLQGSTLKITSPDGITTTSGTGSGIGNVQTPASYRNYDQVATFHYIGKQNQVTGNGITTASTAKIIICELSNNNTQLSFSNSTSITSTTTISPTGGKLDIRTGQVIESETAYITGSTGTLYMSPGTLYKIMKGYAVATTESGSSGGTYIPRMNGSDFQYVLLGGTIELGGNTAGNYFQTLRGTNGGRPNFKYIKFSGQNNYNFSTRSATDYKNLSSTTTIDSALIITGNSIVDCINMSGQAASFIGNGGLVMDNGRIRIKNTSGTQPELIGDNIAYSLTGGTVEFYGTSATQQQQMRGNYKSVNPVKISYYNVDINADAANYDTSSVGAAGNVDMVSSFLLKNALNIYSPAVFRMDESDFIDDAASATNSFSVNTGAGLLYGSTSGITSSGASGNVRISGSRNFLTTASYGFVGNNTMASGNGLPATVASLYVYRNNIQKLVNLTNSVSVTDSLNFYRGIISTGANKVTMLSGSKTAIKDYDPPFTGNSGAPVYIDDRYVIGNLERNINSTGIYVFPVGDAVSGEAYNPLRIQITSGNGMAAAQFIPGDPGTCVAGPVFFSCGPEQRAYNYTDMTTEGRWRMTSSTSTVFAYDIFLHPNIRNLNTTPNVWIDSTGTNYLIDYRSLKAPNGTTDWSSYANTGDRCVSSYYYNIEGKGFSGFSDFAPAGGNTNTLSQLPVELTNFSGSCQDDGSILLSWTTVSEQNSSHYVVERSVNGTGFSPVLTVPAAGNSNAPLNYEVRVPLTAERSYYRLTMVDLDNTFEYSPIIIVSCSGLNSSISVYYSPDEGLILQSRLEESGRYQFSLFDAAGKLMMQENRVLDKGINRYPVDIRKRLAKGIYLFRISNDQSSQTQKIWIY